MKILILILFIVISISSCSKDEIQLNRNYWGTAQVLKNGELWKPLIYATTTSRDREFLYIEMATYDRQIVREELYLTKVAKKEGYNVIQRRTPIPNADNENNIQYYASYYTLEGGDYICNSYQVDDSTEVAGYVNVTKYDEKSGKIEGTFEVTLIKKSSCYTDSPDTLHFTEGVFSTKIQD